MNLNLDGLPYDVLFNIAGRLSFSDVVHLSLTCRQLYQLRNERTLCRKTVENHAPYTKEARLAASEKITYRQALERIYSRRGAFARATPLSACVIDYGSSFIYRQNVLCYMSHQVIHVRCMLGTAEKEVEVDTERMAKWLSHHHFSTTDLRPEINLLHYSDGIVSLHIDYSECELSQRWREDEHWLIYVELQKYDAVTGAGVNIIKPPAGASKLFVRNTANYFYYGTHTGIGVHGHHEWKIKGHSLNPETHPLPDNIPSLQLDDFVGSDLGSTVVFEIHDGYFYAVSNQTSFVVEEVDWTSFYHCVRFPLDRPVKEALQINNRVYRRQHAEGPINDSWTDLSLQIDERTDRLQIVEARREWLNGGSKQERTFYTREVIFPDPPSARRRGASTAYDSQQSLPSASPSALATDSSDDIALPDVSSEEEEEAEAAEGSSSQPPPAPLLPLDDPLAQTIGSGNNPHWAPAEERLPRSYHPERRHWGVGISLESGSTLSSYGGYPTASSSASLSSYSSADSVPLAAEAPPSLTFILARTKLRAYNLSCSAFLDLVEDDRCCPENIFGPPCLRLRIGARRRAPYLPLPVDPEELRARGGDKGKAKAPDGGGSEGGVTIPSARARRHVMVPIEHLPPYEDRFLYSPIRLWPAQGRGDSCGADEGSGAARQHRCKNKLHSILNAPLTPPPGCAASKRAARAAVNPAPTSAFSSSYCPPPATEVVAASDERSIVFLRRPKYGSGEKTGPIVLVSFDKAIDADRLALKVEGTTTSAGETAMAGTGLTVPEMEAMAAGRKDSGMAMDLDSKTAGAETMKTSNAAAGAGRLWKRDSCWDAECACVIKNGTDLV